MRVGAQQTLNIFLAFFFGTPTQDTPDWVSAGPVWTVPSPLSGGQCRLDLSPWLVGRLAEEVYMMALPPRGGSTYVITYGESLHVFLIKFNIYFTIARFSDCMRRKSDRTQRAVSL